MSSGDREATAVSQPEGLRRHGAAADRVQVARPGPKLSLGPASLPWPLMALGPGGPRLPGSA